MGAPIVWFLDEGIVLIEANPALLGQLQAKAAELAANIARLSPLAAAKAYETKEELQGLVDYAQSAFQGDAVLSGIKVVGSAAWSGAVTVGASATFGPTAGISAGIYAGKLYDDLFDAARKLGSDIGIAIYERTHPNALTVSTPLRSISSATANATPVADLNTPARNSANFITDNGANSHTATIGTGGTVSDLWLLQKNAGNNFTLDEFGKAVLASNPDITNINQVRAGQVIYIPQKQADGSTTYNFAGGASVNQNPVTGEYYMVVPNSSAQGGLTVYERKFDGDAGYVVRQVTTNAAGGVTFESLGHQATLNSDIKNISASAQDGVGTTLSTTTAQLFDDGTQLVSIVYPSGIQTIISTDVLGASKQTDYPVPGDLNIKDITNRDALGAVTSSSSIQPQYDVDANNTVSIVPNSYLLVNRDGEGAITATGQRVTNPVDGSYIDSLINALTPVSPYGSFVQYSTDALGNTNTTPTANEIALNNLTFAASQANAAYSLINAIRTNNALGIASSSLQLANGFSSGQIPGLGQLSSSLGIITNLVGLGQALSRGDIGHAILPAANLVNTIATNYAISAGYGNYTFNAAGEQVASTPLQNAINDPIGENIFGAQGEAIGAISEAIPYLNLANDLANGNTIGVIADGLSIAFPPFAPVFQVVGFILSNILADDPPSIPWASANAYWDGSRIQVQSVGSSGGPISYVRDTLASLTGSLSGITDQYNASAQPDLQLGVVTQRLGGLSFNGRNGNLYVNTFDPITGTQLDASVNFSGVFAGSNAQALGSYYIRNALDRQAIAPLWEVSTARAQEANGISNAGLSEIERQANLGHLALATAPTTLLDWNPVGLDLTSKYYKNRSCLRPNLLGRGTKTYLKTGKNCSKRAATRVRNRKDAQKRSDLGSKSSQSRLFMGARGYEINSNLNLTGDLL